MVPQQDRAPVTHSEICLITHSLLPAFHSLSGFPTPLHTLVGLLPKSAIALKSASGSVSVEHKPRRNSSSSLNHVSSTCLFCLNSLLYLKESCSYFHLQVKKMKFRLSNLPKVTMLLRAGAGILVLGCLLDLWLSALNHWVIVWPVTLSRPGLNHGFDLWHVTSISWPLQWNL